MVSVAALICVAIVFAICIQLVVPGAGAATGTTAGGTGCADPPDKEILLPKPEQPAISAAAIATGTMLFIR